MPHFWRQFWFEKSSLVKDLLTGKANSLGREEPWVSCPRPCEAMPWKAPNPLAQSKLDGTPLLVLRLEGRDRDFLVQGVWRMASQFHQLRILVWKNWLGVKRQPVRIHSFIYFVVVVSFKVGVWGTQCTTPGNPKMWCEWEGDREELRGIFSKQKQDT